MSRPPDFNSLARLYRWMEFFSFGPWLALTRGTFLGRLTRSQRALVLGDGDGRFTASLLRANRTVRVDAVDASFAMLDALRRRAGADADRVGIELGDARDWQAGRMNPAEAYDLIVTHFFLDCLTTSEVEGLAAKLRAVVGPAALWVVSEFAIPAGWFGSLVARPVVSGLYFCFGLLTGLSVTRLPDHGAALQRSGFELMERRSRLAGLLVAELWSVGPAVELPG